MAAEDFGRSSESIHSETVDLRERFESSFPIDALLPVLLVENVLTVKELVQLHPTSQSDLADRNRKFLEYLANKGPSAISNTLSVLVRPEYQTYRSFGENLRQLFGVEAKEREGMRGKTSRKPQQGGERGSGAKKVSTLRLSHLTSTGVVCNGLFVDGIVWNVLELQSWIIVCVNASVP